MGPRDAQPEGRGAAPVHSPGAAGGRILFVDNLRTMLTILVVLFHIMIIYSGVGSWYYGEGRADEITGLIGGWFIVVTQAFFMGLFLLISAYFVPGSYDRKGPARFLRDRLIRLGIPLAAYSWVLRPLLIYLDPIKFPGSRPSAYHFLTAVYFPQFGLLGGGPLWFVETLLIFSVVYVAWRLLVPARQGRPPITGAFPGSGAIALFALLLALAGFLVRLRYPIDWVFKPLNLQFPFFAQYVALFMLGVVAYRHNWLVALPDTVGRRWLYVGGLLALVLPAMTLIGGGPERFKGGLHWQALVFALWESFLCLGACLGLVYLFRRRVCDQGKLARALSRAAYATYIVHGPAITVVAYAARALAWHPLLKFALVSLLSLPLCFALGGLIRRLPYLDAVL